MPTLDVDDESFKADAEGEAPHIPENVGDAKDEVGPAANDVDVKGQIEGGTPEGQTEAGAQALTEAAAPSADGLEGPGAPQKAGRWWQCFSSKAGEPIPAEPPVEAPVEAPVEGQDSKDVSPSQRAQTMPPNMKPLASPVLAAGAEDQKANNEDLPAEVAEDAPVTAAAEDAPVTVAVEDAPPADVDDEKVTVEERPPQQVSGSKRGSAQELQDKLAKQLQKEEAGISAVDHIGPKEGAVTKVHSELRHKLAKQAKKAETGEVEPERVDGIEEVADENADGDVPTVEGAGVEGVQARNSQV